MRMLIDMPYVLDVVKGFKRDLLSLAPPPIARHPRQFFGPLNQPKWTQVDVKKVRQASTQIDENNGIRSVLAIGVCTRYCRCYLLADTRYVYSFHGTVPEGEGAAVVLTRIKITKK